jgi:acyl phosphate:glycerol-3-phosphate acyltransferase
MVLTREQWGAAAACILAGYLCGSIPFGLLLGWLKGVDIRTQGSGNIGATNVGRVLGRPWGILAFVLDVCKSLVPVLLFGLLVQRWQTAGGESIRSAVGHLLQGAMAAVCVLGHVFPVFLRFKGGKGVATSLGALLGFYPYFTCPGAIAFGLWIVLTLSTRYVSVGSVGAVAAFPIIFATLATLKADQWGTGRQLWPLYVFAITIAGLVVYRHRGNLRRLYQGVEPRIGSSTAGKK